MSTKNLFVGIIDDDEFAFYRTRDILENHLDPELFAVDLGREAKDVETNDKALWTLEVDPVDIVVLDARLKDGLSTKLVEGVKKSKPLQSARIAFVVHSSDWNDPEIREKFVSVGITRGAMKYDVEGLKAAILEAAKELESRS